MCGIVGILAQNNVNQSIYDALNMIQHRGQDAAGIMTSDGDRTFIRKSNGLVRDVIRKQHIFNLRGFMGVGHVRYPTSGTQDTNEAQPLYVNSPYGLSIVHNGNLVNAASLKKHLVREDLRHLNTDSDSEILLNVFAHELQRQGQVKLHAAAVFKAAKNTHQRCLGAYAAIIMITGHGLLAIRDPHGIRPLVYGRRKTPKGPEYMFASESIALDILGYECLGDVLPGEAIFADVNGRLHRQVCTDTPSYSPCLFEYVYLARPDSIIDGISVHKVRLAMGTKLAQNILRNWPEHDIDVVIPVPDTSRTAAIPLAYDLNVKYREGFVKNRYVGRTFIMPEQKQRYKSVRQKLNVIQEEFKGKNVLLVDDSIVRGTTSKQIIQMAREAGAKKVYFASAAPEVRYPNVYGIDMPASTDLIAHNRSIKQIAKFIGADKLIYQTLEDLYDAVLSKQPDKKDKAHQISRFEDSVFTGHYVTKGVSATYLKKLEEERGAR